MYQLIKTGVGYRLLVFVLLVSLISACTAPAVDPPPTNVPPVLETASTAPTIQPTASQQSTTTVVEPTPEPTDLLEETQTSVPEPVSAETPLPTQPVSLPATEGIGWIRVADGLDSPVGMAVAGDGSGRIFVLEQAGRIMIVQDNTLIDTPFLDITGRVGSTGNEQGLLGLAFHPNYVENGFFYINYTDRNGDTVIARYQVSDDPNQADAPSEKVLLQVVQPFANHNGGGTLFGPDGYLYLSLGDGGSGGDPQGNAQSVDTLLGKILRIAVDSGDPYVIPVDNPFTAGGGRAEIWHYGLRNPWRFSFDRLNGDMFIADVGQNQWEEIDYWPVSNPGGANFGWDYREGAHPFEGEPPDGLELVDPVAEYGRSDGCSVTGGVVYRGQQLPEMSGVYLYGDYCSGKIWGMIPGDPSWQTEVLFETPYNITSFGEDENGEVYLLDREGAIYRLDKT